MEKPVKMNPGTGLHSMVRSRDPHGVITNNKNAWHEEENIKYTATKRALNGCFWECYIGHNKLNSGRLE